MKLTPAKFKNILKIAKEMNVKAFEMDGIKIEFFEKQVGVSTDLKSITKALNSAQMEMPSEDEMLYWSTDYDPKEEKRKTS